MVALRRGIPPRWGDRGQAEQKDGDEAAGSARSGGCGDGSWRWSLGERAAALTGVLRQEGCDYLWEGGAG